MLTYKTYYMSRLWWWNICYDMILAIECNVLFNMLFVKHMLWWAGCDDGIYVMIWYEL